MHKFLSLLFSGIMICCCAGEKPLAKAGIITDTHVLADPASGIPVEKAMRIFKREKVDLIINCGDVAAIHDAKAYKNYRDAVKKVYSAKVPTELFSFANHDRVGLGSYEKAWPFFKKRLEIKHEPYSKTTIAGHIFLTAPQNVKWKIYEKYIADACRETPDKPVFLVDHVPALCTTYGSIAEGIKTKRKILDKYPQIVHLSGHSHGTLKNEQNIWQGTFTAVNAGCTCSFTGFLVNTAPRGQKSQDALVMEIYRDKLVFRRFDLAAGSDGLEYKPDAPWSIPLPFDPASAPYTAEKRRKLSPPEFPAGAKLAIRPDKLPCNNMNLEIPETAGDGAFIYKILIFRKSENSNWTQFAAKEIFGSYNTAPEKRKKSIVCALASSYFDTGKDYKIEVYPLNFFYTAGKKLAIEFSMPEQAANTVLFKSENPMKDCLFYSGRRGSAAVPVKDGFYLLKSGFSRLNLPDKKVWAGPAGTRFRLTLDMHFIQPEEGYRWMLQLCNVTKPVYACSRIATPPGDSGSYRLVVDFDKRAGYHVYELLVSRGEPGQVKFDFVKLEKITGK